VNAVVVAGGNGGLEYDEKVVCVEETVRVLYVFCVQSTRDLR